MIVHASIESKIRIHNFILSSRYTVLGVLDG